MDLADLAERLVDATARDAAISWLAELPTSMHHGEAVKHHIEGEVNLQTTPEGLGAIRNFAEALPLRSGGEDPVAWYEGRLRDRATAPDFVLHGPFAEPSLPDELCRLMPARSVLHHLGRPDTLTLVPAALGGDPRLRLETWLQSVCSPAYVDLLDRAKLVSGVVPSVFSTFEVDRNAAFPPGTSAATCRQVLGLTEEPTPSAHALVKYRKSVVGPARLPTAFDASTHAHFLPPALGAPCGTTKNLATSGAGVREIVVAPFPVDQLDEPEFVPR